MGLINGLRKLIAETPSVPEVPKIGATLNEKKDFAKAFHGFHSEIDNYEKKTVIYDKPVYFQETRIDQYKEFLKDVAKYIKTLDEDKDYQRSLLKIEARVAYHLLDRLDLVKITAKSFPELIKHLPQSIQDDSEIANSLIEFNVGKVKYLSKKFLNDPEFMWKCLNDKTKFQDILPGFHSFNNRIDVVNAIGEELRSRLEWHDKFTIVSQLEKLIETDRIAKEMSAENNKKIKSRYIPKFGM